MKPGTPAGRQLDRGVKAIFPAITSSLSFFIRSFTQGLRLGLVRSIGRLPARVVGNKRIGLTPPGTVRNRQKLAIEGGGKPTADKLCEHSSVRQHERPS